MHIKVENEIGTIEINTEVIRNIAGAAAIECYGLVGMASKSATSGIADLLMREIK